MLTHIIIIFSENLKMVGFTSKFWVGSCLALCAYDAMHVVSSSET